MGIKPLANMPAVHRDARPADYGVHIYVYVICTRAQSAGHHRLGIRRQARSGDKKRLKAVSTENRDKQLVGKYLVVNVHWQCSFLLKKKRARAHRT